MTERSLPASSASVFILCIVLSGIFFSIDLIIPLGVAAGVPYIAVVLAALRLPDTRYILLFAVTSSILTILGYFLSPALGEPWQVIFNRFLALFAIWVTAILTIRFKISVREREMAEERARNLQTNLAYFSKMSIMGEMATGVAHEINQPLAAITTYSDVCRRLIQQESLDKKELEHCFEKISEQATRAGKVIQDIRNFIKKGEVERTAANINDLILEVIQLVEIDTHKHRRRIEVDLEDNLPLSRVNTIQIQQVIINLIRNGLDSMEGHCSNNEYLLIRTKNCDDGYIELAVIDRGKGISEKLDNQLFEPLVTTKDSGMGMGLSICRSIINSHGGKMGYIPNTDQGVSFYCRLPTCL